MKKIILFTILLLSFLITLSAQNVFISNGDAVVRVEQYGALRYSTISGTDTLIQIDRASLLVGGAENQVFDYYNDAENIEAASVIDSPLLSDYEATVLIDNSYSGLAPAVEARINAYMWNDGSYVIFKFSIKNTDAAAVNLRGGLEILPQISNEYGFEKVELSSRSSDFTIYKDNADYVGVRILNNPLVSLRTIDWFDGYNSSDTDLWEWLTYDAFDSTFASGADGVVSFVSQASLEITSGETLEMYIAFASGNTDDEVEANMKLALVKYNNIATSVDEQSNQLPLAISLEQNYPNPFNPTTSINYSVPSNNNVALKVYDILGNEIATLVNEQKSVGSYEVEFNAGNLPSGIYFYTLTSGNFVQAKKMMLVK